MVTPPSNPIRVFNLGRIEIANDNSALPVVNFLKFSSLEASA